MSNNKTGGTDLTGINPLAYMGVEPSSPPQLVRYQRQPTTRDFSFNIGTIWLVQSPVEVWMLVAKPQNVADWILMASGVGNVSEFLLDVGTAVPDVNGIVNLLGSTNINTLGDNANTMFVSLNDSILLPATTDANHGVIGLGIDLTLDRFMHNYSPGGSADGNTFLGIESGSFTLTGTHNTGLGQFTLAFLTTGSNNIAIGPQVLDNLTSGSHNIVIGSASATIYTTESNNIIVGNDGIALDSGVTRIGTETVQTTAYVAGITGVNTTFVNINPQMVVNVGTDGQLGETKLISSDSTLSITSTFDGGLNKNVIDFTVNGGGGGGGGTNPFAFSYVQVGDSGAIANGTDYVMGSQVAMTKIFDIGNNFNPGAGGGGAGAFYTAPVTAKYYFEFSPIFAQGPSTTTFINSIVTSRPVTYQYTSSTQGDGNTEGSHNLIIDLNIGETVTFTAINPIYGGGATYIVSGNGGVLGSSNINSTRISGFLIPEGASGGNFSQPFLGIQVANVTIPVAEYFLGDSSPMNFVTSYDIGSNFFAGDGLGLGNFATYTAQDSGIFSFTMNAMVFFSGGIGSGAGGIFFKLYVNGVFRIQFLTSRYVNQGYILPLNATCDVELLIGDVVSWSIVPNDTFATNMTISSNAIGGNSGQGFILGKRIA